MTPPSPRRDQRATTGFRAGSGQVSREDRGWDLHSLSDPAWAPVRQQPAHPGQELPAAAAHFPDTSRRARRRRVLGPHSAGLPRRSADLSRSQIVGIWGLAGPTSPSQTHLCCFRGRATAEDREDVSTKEPGCRSVELYPQTQHRWAGWPASPRSPARLGADEQLHAPRTPRTPLRAGRGRQVSG